MMSDVAFPTNGVKEYRTDRQVWTIVVQGKVAIALDERWADRWHRAGATVRCAKGGSDRSNRVMLISVRGERGRRGAGSR
eukprot:5009224-Alexandrium_andersonii.AAC.1